MISDKAASYLAPSIAARVVEFLNDGSQAPTCVVEHQGASSDASCAITYQESDDGVSWTDIAGTAATILGGASNRQVVTSRRSRIALMAGGNVRINFKVTRQVNGSPTSLGTA